MTTTMTTTATLLKEMMTVDHDVRKDKYWQSLEKIKFAHSYFKKPQEMADTTIEQALCIFFEQFAWNTDSRYLSLFLL